MKIDTRMPWVQRCSLLALVCGALMMAGCASNSKNYDYTAFKAHQPRSILVLPPVNNTPDVAATYSVLAQVTHPLAESGYYVLPVALVAETFKQNGLYNPPEMHDVSPAKLQEIFGADAALYITVTRYGASYAILSSEVTVTATAKLVDLKTATVLWDGAATASTAENNNNSGGGLLGVLVAAAVKQVLNNLNDQSHNIAGLTSERLLSAGRYNGILYGPRSPMFGKEGQP